MTHPRSVPHTPTPSTPSTPSTSQRGPSPLSPSTPRRRPRFWSASDSTSLTRLVVEVTASWGEGQVLDVAHLVPGETWTGFVRAGTAGEVWPPAEAGSGLEASGGCASPRVRAVGQGAEVEVPEGARLRRDDAPVAVSAAGWQRVAEGDRLVIEMGELRYAVRLVPAGERVAARVAFDRRPLAYVLGSAAFHLVLFGVFALAPPRAGALSGDIIDTQSRIVSHYLAARVTPPPEPTVSAPVGDDALGGSAATAGEAGAVGRPDAPRAPGRLSVRGSAERADPRLGPVTSAAVERAGILGVLASGVAWDQPASPYAASRAIGSDAISALGALTGGPLGGRYGLFGLGIDGPGARGGGDLRDAIAGGPLRTVGSRGPYGVGTNGLCRDPADCRQGRVPPQGVVVGRPETRGALSAAVIRRVVSRHRSEVRFCYEQGLQQRPDLAGRVSARFIIGATGAVTASMVTESSLGHGGVEQCVAQAIRRWSFPSPEDGGVVSVTYPFLFQSGG